MTRCVQFFVAGVPKSMSVGSVTRGGFQVRRNTSWATLVGHEGRLHAPTSPWRGPVRIQVDFWFQRPKAARRRAAPIVRPDIDNLFHKLTDQWNGVFWLDDAQIVDVQLRKHYAVGHSGAAFTLAELLPASPAGVQTPPVRDGQAAGQ